MTTNTTDSVLYALYCLSRDTCHIDAAELGKTVGLSASEAASALVQLERAGLVDASRARLTMPGLARAAALGARGNGGPRVDLGHTKRRVKSQRVAPMAAHSVVPEADRAPSPTEAHEQATDLRALAAWPSSSLHDMS